MPRVNLFVAKRHPPVNLSTREELSLFGQDFEALIPYPQVRILRSVVISAEGLLFQNNQMMPESFSQPESYERWKLRSVLKAYVYNLLVRPRNRRKRAVWVTDDWSAGYFHWLGDVLPKLVIGRAEIEESGLLLPAIYQDIEFATAALKMLGINNVEYVPKGETIEVETLFMPLHTSVSGDYNEAIVREIRNKFRPASYRSPENDRIYITRRRAAKRRIANENELTRIVESYGFHIVETEVLSFVQQVELFNRCSHLISIHGAGLTNMLFMPEGSRVLELRKNDRRVPNCFFNLASALNLGFYVQLCKAVRPTEAPHSADIVVDTALLRSNIEILIDRNDVVNEK